MTVHCNYDCHRPATDVRLAEKMVTPPFDDDVFSLHIYAHCGRIVIFAFKKNIPFLSIWVLDFYSVCSPLSQRYSDAHLLCNKYSNKSWNGLKSISNQLFKPPIATSNNLPQCVFDKNLLMKAAANENVQKLEPLGCVKCEFRLVAGKANYLQISANSNFCSNTRDMINVHHCNDGKAENKRNNNLKHTCIIMRAKR